MGAFAPETNKQTIPMYLYFFHKLHFGVTNSFGNMQRLFAETRFSTAFVTKTRCVYCETGPALFTQ